MTLNKSLDFIYNAVGLLGRLHEIRMCDLLSCLPHYLVFANWHSLTLMVNTRSMAYFVDVEWCSSNSPDIALSPLLKERMTVSFDLCFYPSSLRIS